MFSQCRVENIIIAERKLSDSTEIHGFDAQKLPNSTENIKIVCFRHGAFWRFPTCVGIGGFRRAAINADFDIIRRIRHIRAGNW